MNLCFINVCVCVFVCQSRRQRASWHLWMRSWMFWNVAWKCLRSKLVPPQLTLLSSLRKMNSLLMILSSYIWIQIHWWRSIVSFSSVLMYMIFCIPKSFLVFLPSRHCTLHLSKFFLGQSKDEGSWSGVGWSPEDRDKRWLILESPALAQENRPWL